MPNAWAQSAQVRPTTAIEVLEALVTKLRASITVLNSETTCFLSDVPWPSVEIQGNLFATICIANGRFDQPIMDGSGNLGTVELMSVLVSVWSRMEMDQIERYALNMTDASRGLLTMKQSVLKAIAGKNLDGGTYNGASSLLLLESMYPSTASHPPGKQDDFASFAIAFDCKFWWNMETDSVLT